MKDILLRQTHLVWIVSIYNISIGFFISGFNPISKSISHVALEAPFYAYSHRAADIIIGASMCFFAITIQYRHQYKLTLAALSIFLLGVSMISAGIWTLESKLHLLYGLSIFMIIIPVAFALEFEAKHLSTSFYNFCLALSFIHVTMFWLIYAGFIPSEYNGLIQRIWAIPTMGWFGCAAHILMQKPANKAF
ncbi:DUF998 domain-containing protein [Pseudoalteromonas ulvae]|uniref:DUF998 domain-containing protein n=1 Tax=Pseudoalteromonas ulvae TaxID=107327 RepID=A0A244CNR4_PSEDV|nr:DUF998 domain-containing protein [Pseudoalteromonas ulvae]OUL57260.1 hypothetical protein B1199_13915 [Pseudoalteromonas ulvae]